MVNNKQGLVNRVGHEGKISSMLSKLVRTTRNIHWRSPNPLPKSRNTDQRSHATIKQRYQSEQVCYLGARLMAAWDFQKLQNVAKRSLKWTVSRSSFLCRTATMSCFGKINERWFHTVEVAAWHYSTESFGVGVLSHPWTGRRSSNKEYLIPDSTSQ